MRTTTFVLAWFCFVYAARCQEPTFIVKEPKEVPRKLRAPDGFENFFLKASKSVPRIGRRDKNDRYIIEGPAGWHKQNIPVPKLIKRFENGLNDLPWNELADKVEYYPEIFMSPSLWNEATLRDQEDWEHRMKRSKPIQFNKEIPEYRVQPDVQ